MKKRILIIIGIIIILSFGWLGFRSIKGGNEKVSFRLSYVQKGNVIQTVNATGTVQPMQLIQVGTQVTGPIKKLNVDFNSPVTEGQIVAQIDPAIYETNVTQAKANLSRSKAGVEQVKANLMLAEKELLRDKELAAKDLISNSELDAAVANRDSLIAQLKSAEATVEQSESSLQTAQVNLDYTTIKSPVDGIVISRNVDEGQTVVANYSAQVLFTIATDIKKMQINATVPEADIGKIAVGQVTTFTVDAYQEMEFVGKVVQIRLSSTTVQNVVTYTVIIHADNPDEKLLPGMTANITFVVANRTDTLKIANAALRYSPDEALIEKQEENKPEGILLSSGKMTEKDNAPPKREQRPKRERPASTAGIHLNKVWVVTESGLLNSLSITTGITDGSFTEIVRGNIQEGQGVVTGIMAKGEVADKNMVNPFMPQRPGGGRRVGR